MVLAPSEASKRDVIREFGVESDRVRVVLLGVDDGFVPPTAPRVPGRILAMASADAPMKGIATLLEAFAKLRTERPRLELLLVTRPQPGGRTEQLLDELAIRDHVQLRARPQRRRAGHPDGLGRARVRSQPLRRLLAADGRADGDRHAAGRVAGRGDPRGRRPGRPLCDLVTPGRRGELVAALGALLDDPERRARYGAAGRRRVEELSAGGPSPPPPPRRTTT